MLTWRRMPTRRHRSRSCQFVRTTRRAIQPPIHQVSETNLNTRNIKFGDLLEQVEAMSDEQRRAIGNQQEDEHFTISVDDYASPDDFQKAVVAMIVQLIAPG